MSDEAIPEADRAGDAPHPRLTRRLYGQAAAEAAFLDAWNGGRPHHAWLLTGPRGVGKATLAWRIARFLLADPPRLAATLDVADGHPVLARIRALSEPRLMLLRRPWDEKRRRLRAEITVEEARRLAPFFGLAAGGRRVVIVDAADDLNRSASNAILKLLEEPPAGATLLLVSHQPTRLLPTIRSRCRVLRLAPLGADDLAGAVRDAGGTTEAAGGLALLAEGSVGEALALAETGEAVYAALVRLFGAPMDHGAARRLADSCAGRAGEPRLEAVLALVPRLLHRAARAGTLAPGPEAVPGEAATLARLAPDLQAARRLAEAAPALAARGAHGRAVNVEAAALVWDQLAGVETAARGA